MPEGNAVLIFIIATAAIALVAWAGYLWAEAERKRLAALAGWAAANGFSFDEGDPHNLDARFAGLLDIGKGHGRCAYEVLALLGPAPVYIFKYQYKTWETRTVTSNNRTYTEQYEETHRRQYLIAELGSAFPPMMLRQENMFDKIAGAFGFDDINFESAEFSKQYFCKSENREFAYAIIHPQMMEWLLGQRFAAQILGRLLLMDICGYQYTADGVLDAYAQAAGFIDRIPPFVWKDYGHCEPISLALPSAYVPPPVAATTA